MTPSWRWMGRDTCSQVAGGMGTYSSGARVSEGRWSMVVGFLQPGHPQFRTARAVLFQFCHTDVFRSFFLVEHFSPSLLLFAIWGENKGFFEVRIADVCSGNRWLWVQDLTGDHHHLNFLQQGQQLWDRTRSTQSPLSTVLLLLRPTAPTSARAAGSHLRHLAPRLSLPGFYCPCRKSSPSLCRSPLLRKPSPSYFWPIPCTSASHHHLLPSPKYHVPSGANSKGCWRGSGGGVGGMAGAGDTQ